MTQLERAKQYAAIFVNAGDRWRFCVPVDAIVTGDVVHLDDVTLEYSPNGWRVEAGDEAWVFPKAATR